jgi:RNA polymerase sigma factor (sigma-70 family)
MKSVFTTLHDMQLIQAIRSGDKEASGELYHRYYKRVFRKCHSFTRDNDTAFDLAQESLLKALEKLHTFRGESSFSTWLFSITQRHCLGALKKESKLGQRLDVFEPPGNFSAVDEGVIEREEIMYGLLHALPEPEFQLLSKKYLDGHSVERLQSTFNLSSSAVKMRLKRSKEKLNALYGLAITYSLEQVLNQL